MSASNPASDGGGARDAGDGSAPQANPFREWQIATPDWVLLRRFGLVRVVGGGAYIVAVAIVFAIFGGQAWPLLLGVPVLLGATLVYFRVSERFPRAAVAGSLVADALVLGGAVAFLGGTGSGLVLVYAIVVVSAGLLLGPSAALAFTGLTAGLGLLQLAVEQAGLPPVLLHREPIGERLPILLASLGALLSVGYLSAIYASRLHELIDEAGRRAEAVRRRGRRRQSLVEQATVDVQRPLRAVEEVAEAIDERWATLTDAERRYLAGRLRMGVTQLDAEIGMLADAGAIADTGELRFEPVRFDRVVADCCLALGDRLAEHELDCDVPDLKVVGDRRAARRVVLNLLENVAEHTPPGTHVRVTALPTAGYGVLVVSDNGPGVPDAHSAILFDIPEGGPPRVGLPLVRELCEAMGGEIRHEIPPGGGARFLVSFRLAPQGAPSADDEPAMPPSSDDAPGASPAADDHH